MLGEDPVFDDSFDRMDLDGAGRVQDPSALGDRHMLLSRVAGPVGHDHSQKESWTKWKPRCSRS